MGIYTRKVDSPSTLAPKPDEPVTGKAALHEQSQMKLVGLIEQVSQLFVQTNEMFLALMDEASETAERISSLGQRVQRVSSVVPAARERVQSYSPCDLLTTPQPSGCRTAKIKEKAQLLAADNRSEALEDVVDSVTPPPALETMDEFTDDGSSCLKKYTNPEFFFETWLMEQEKKIAEAKERRDKRQAQRMSMGASTEKRVVRKVEKKRDKISAMGAEFAEGATAPSTGQSFSTQGIGSNSVAPKKNKKEKEKKPKEKKDKEKKDKDKEKKDKSKDKKEKKPKKEKEKEKEKAGRKRGFTARLGGGSDKQERRGTSPPAMPSRDPGGLPPPVVGDAPSGGAGLPPPSIPSRDPVAPPPPPMPTAPSAPPMPAPKAAGDEGGAVKKPNVQTTSLLSQIQSGVTLRKAEVREEEVPVDAAKATIAQILARRAAMESDSEAEDDDDWD